MSQLVMVYSTIKNSREAHKIARILINNKLSSCVNIIKEVDSVYLWKGKITKSKEVILLTKTKEHMYKKLEAKIKEVSSYECPCIVCIPILDGNIDYISWTLENLTNN